MKHKAMFMMLGVIKAYATNGLSIFAKGDKRDQISGGRIGDVVVKEGENILIISKDEWNAMPKDAEEAQELQNAKVADVASLTDEIASLKAELETLKKQKGDNDAGRS